LLGTENLIIVDKRIGLFTLKAQGGGLSRILGQRNELFANMTKPSDIWIRHLGFEHEMEQLCNQLISIFQPQRFRVQEGGIGASFLGSKYIEIILHPNQDAVKRVKKFVRRMWKAFGTTLSTTGI
jgi:hypothetical protein